MKWYRSLLNYLHRPLVRKGEADPYHGVFAEFQALVQQMSSPTVLELGSRNVTGVTRRHLFPDAGRYVGFDIHPGAGVDVVGDVHQLTKHVPPASVDAVFSVSVFEHLVYPWKAVLEINRVLKPGGIMYVSTHPTWPPHELPWDFWRFPVAGLKHLFISPTGFEVVSAVEGLPARLYSLVTDPPTRAICHFTLNMAVALIARKTADYDSDRLRWDIDIAQSVQSSYPLPT